MPRPRVIATVAAVLAALALLAGTAGCKAQLAGSGSGGHASAASAHHKKQHTGKKHKKTQHKKHAKKHHKAHPKARRKHAAPADTLVIEPRAGFGPVYRLITRAEHRIDLTMYEFEDSTAEHDLAAAARRGVDVRVVLDQKEKSDNSSIYRYLRSHQVHVTWSSTRFTYTHQKTLVADGTAVIMTANLTSEYYSSTRDFLVVDRRASDVSAIARVFSADFAHRPVKPGHGADLVWSPGSESALLSVINRARHSLRIYSEEMSDAAVEGALERAARRGVDVQVCGENSGGEYDSAFKELARAGVRIAYYSSDHGFYIHGKVIEADYGTRSARMFIGSENFSATSFDRNRELGLIFSSGPALKAMATSFAGDFKRGQHYQG